MVIRRDFISALNGLWVCPVESELIQLENEGLTGGILYGQESPCAILNYSSLKYISIKLFNVVLQGSQ